MLILSQDGNILVSEFSHLAVQHCTSTQLPPTIYCYTPSGLNIALATYKTEEECLAELNRLYNCPTDKFRFKQKGAW